MTLARAGVDELVEQVRTGPQGPDVAAFLDFDGTLIDGYSARALYADRLRSREVGLAELVELARLVMGPDTATQQEFTELVERGLAGFAGRDADELSGRADRLYRTTVARSLFHPMWRVVKAHQEQGHTVVLATSATRLQVEPLAREIGIEHLLCTELETAAGLLTGRVAGEVPWGRGKAGRVRAFAAEHGLDLARAYGYANGDEDIPFLEAVGRPHAVNAQPRLAVHARSEGWPRVEVPRAPSRLDPKPALRTGAMYGALLGAGAAGAVVGALGRDRRRGIDFATSVFSYVAGAAGQVDVHVQGEPHLWSHRPAVFIVNHQSSLVDLVVTTTLLRGGFTAVVKREVADIPVFGPLLTMADFAFIDRTDASQARDVLADAKEKLGRGISIAISPEGTRSYTPEVGVFKKGAFHLAQQAGVPVVPIVIRNAGELMWRDARVARPGRVDVVVHPPIPTTDWTKADLDRAVVDVRELYRTTLANWPSGPATVRGVQ